MSQEKTEQKTVKDSIKGIMVFDVSRVMALSSDKPLSTNEIKNIDWGYEVCTADFPLPDKEVRDKEVSTWVKLDYLRQILKTADDLGIKGPKGEVLLTTAPDSFIKISWEKSALYLAPRDKQEHSIQNPYHKSTEPK